VVSRKSETVCKMLMQDKAGWCEYHAPGQVEGSNDWWCVWSAAVWID
jgi:hypothetical protein